MFYYFTLIKNLKSCLHSKRRNHAVGSMPQDQRKDQHLGSVSLQTRVLHGSCRLAVSLSSAKTVCSRHSMAKCISLSAEGVAWGHQM